MNVIVEGASLEVHQELVCDVRIPGELDPVRKISQVLLVGLRVNPYCSVHHDLSHYIELLHLKFICVDVLVFMSQSLEVSIKLILQNRLGHLMERWRDFLLPFLHHHVNSVGSCLGSDSIQLNESVDRFHVKVLIVNVLLDNISVLKHMSLLEGVVLQSELQFVQFGHVFLSCGV